MPLLYGKPVVKKKLVGLEKDAVVYVNDRSDEIFTDYREFSDRVIQCNSMAWECAITGRLGLTFEEAVESENEALRVNDRMDVQLRIPIIYLASKTNHNEFAKVVDDVFNFVKNRYFCGEIVEVVFQDNVRRTCHVQNIATHLDEEEIAKNRSADHYPPDIYHYEVSSAGKEYPLIEACSIRRKEGTLTKRMIWEFLALYAEMPAGGKWHIREEVLQSYGIPAIVTFQRLFWGYPPTFQLPESVKSSRTLQVKEKKQVNIEKYLISPQIPKDCTPPNPVLGKQESSLNEPPRRSSKEQKEYAKKVSKKYQATAKKIKERRTLMQTIKMRDGTSLLNLKKQIAVQALLNKRREIEDKKKEKAAIALQEKHRQLEEKRLEKAKLKEEKLRIEKLVKEWKRQREDLECEDLKDLPMPKQVQCSIPNEHFGDLMIILEFLHSFGEVLSIKTYFPAGITFEIVERALMVEEAGGPLCEILQLLITALFKIQGEEDEEVDESDPQLAALQNCEKLTGDKGEALTLAMAAKSCGPLYLGMPLKELYLDAVTLTEIIRLHFLSSGRRPGEKRAKWWYQQRGGYTPQDDPGLLLCLQEPKLLHDLAYKSVDELPLGDKLKICSCLINQILTYATLRDIIDERSEKFRLAKAQLKVLQLNEVKKAREAAAARLKEKKEAKLKGQHMPLVSGNDVNNGKGNQIENLKDQEESLRKKEESRKKAVELCQIAMSYQVLPLGTDRAYRRYWMFSSLPGLFVERLGEYTGCCLSRPTPHNPVRAPPGDMHSYVQRLHEEENSTSSDKENDDSDTDLSPQANSPSKKMLAEKNASDLVIVEKSRMEVDNICSKPNQDLLCTANEECSIHADSPKMQNWAFFDKEDEFIQLLECLNVRGVREGELRQALMQDKDNIVKSILRCPVHRLDPSHVDAASVPEARKSARANPVYRPGETNFGYPLGTPLSDIWDRTIRDDILDTEDRLYRGGLGVLKVHDRDAWRDAIYSHGYDKQCDRLVWGGKSNLKELEAFASNVSMENSDGGETSTGSGAHSPELSSKSDSMYASSHPEMSHQISVVRSLACAILQVAQCIPTKYLKKPLGMADNPTEAQKLRGWWEMSLMESTSYSQIYLHLTTLDNSIQWSKSASKAYCRLCKRGSDAEKMLLCDECNKGHHIYCLKPKLTKIPQGDWFCPTCRPEVKVKPVRKSRPLFLEDSESEESDKQGVNNNKCYNCGIEGKLFSCNSCHQCCHVECRKPSLSKQPKGEWHCSDCKTTKEQKIMKVNNSLPKHSSETGGDGSSASWDEDPGSSHRLSVEEVYSSSLSADEETGSSQISTERVAGPSLKRKKVYSPSVPTDEVAGPSHILTKENSASSHVSIGKAAFSSPVSTKKVASCSPHKGARKKTGVAASRRSARYSQEIDMDLPLNNAVLQDLLTDLMNHKDGWPFLRPVAGVPDYHFIVKKPMDFGTMRCKLNTAVYTNNKEFVLDALLVFENCEMYNHEETDIFQAGVRLSRYFNKRRKQLGL